MATKDKKKKKERLSSAQRAATHNVGRDFAALTVPNGLNMIKIKDECKKRWSIVPFEATEANPLAVKFDRVGKLYFERTYWVHARIGPNNDSYACPARCTAHLPPKKRLKCPICEERARLAKGGDVDDDVLKSLLPKERQLWLIYDHDETDKGVQLFEVSFHGLGKDLDEAVRSDREEEEPEGYEYFADTEEGYVLRISFKEAPTGGNGKWYPPARIDFKERTKALPDEIAEHGIAVDKIVKLVPYDELASLFMQETSEDDDDDEEEDERPRKKKKKPVVEDDEDGDDAEEEEEEEEEERPKKKKKRPVEDDDDDDDSDDDDDEPVRKKRKSKM